FQVTVTEQALQLVESTIPNSAEYTFDGKNTYNTNTVKNPTEDEPDEPEDEDFGKVIIEADGTETKVSTGAFGDTVTFDVSIDAVNLVENEIQDDNLYNDQVAYYYIYDQMDRGFTLTDSSFTLTINNTTYNVTYDADKTAALTSGVKYYTIGDGTNESYLFTYVDAGTGYTIIEAKIAWADSTTGNGLYPDCEVHLTYTATINEDAVIASTGNLNRAIYDYSVVGDNDPYEPNPEKPTYPDGSDLNHDVSEITTVTYTYALGIYKVSEETGDPLSGAVFSFKDSKGNTIYAVPTSEDGVYNYTSDKDAEGATDEFTSNSDGQVIIKGVDVGTYTLTEVQAPSGYTLLTDSVELTAQMDSSTETYNSQELTTTRYFAAITEAEFDAYGDDVYKYDVDTDTYVVVEKPDEYTEELYKLVSSSSEAEETETTVVTEFSYHVASVMIENKAGSSLPSTGGIGTTIFYVVGGVLVVGAVVLFITKKRMGE
ncbi:MAG: LPXTG cell wall anchor domain-containing protein, partial [Clostridiales bacterium]|nr:LPXTG cell wall anchor domain-containing protein [Clostridiales bacterium]